MSRAFVKESDQDNGLLPERVISSYPNLVTTRGLSLLETRVRALESERSTARQINDTAVLARIARDLRYFQARRESARPVAAPINPDLVRFGVTVRLRLSDKTEHKFTLVGEDEADPKVGLLSFVSPLAVSLLGREIGDEVSLSGQVAQIVALES